MTKSSAASVGVILLLAGWVGGSCSPDVTTTPAQSPVTTMSTTATSVRLPDTTATRPTAAVPDFATTSSLLPAVDTQLGQLRVDVEPREGVRVAVGGLRESPSDGIDGRKRLIEGELIIENRSTTPFAYGPDDFRLYVGPFRPQISGLTVSTLFPVDDAVLAPVEIQGHPFLRAGVVAAGETLHGYLLTWVADRGTTSSGLEYRDAESGNVWTTSIVP